MRFLENLPIRTKVLAISMLMVPALLGIVWLATNGMIQQGLALRRINEITLSKNTLIDKFRLVSEQVQSDVFRAAVFRSMDLPQKERDAVYMRLERGLSDMYNFYGEMLLRWQLDPEEKEILTRIEAPMNVFRSQAQQAVLVIRSNPSFGILLVRSAAAAFYEFHSALNALHKYYVAKIIRMTADSEREAMTIRTNIFALAMAFLLVTPLATLFFGNRYIAAPITGINRLMRRLAQGDLSIDLAGRQRKDEIGDMARALETFRDNAVQKAKTDEDLHASEESYRLLFSRMLNGFALHEIICDEDGKPIDYYFVEANEEFHKMTELPTDQFIGKTVRQVFPEISNDIIETYGSVALSGHAVSFERYVPKMDKYFSISAYCPRHGQFATILEDITERKLAEKKRQSLELEAQRLQKLESLGVLAGGIAHDFNNLLMIIHGNTSIARQRIPETSPLTPYIASIESASQRAALLTRQMLAYSGGGAFLAKTINLSMIIEEMSPLIAAIGLKKLKFKTVLPPGLPPIKADVSHIQQIVINLLTNASEAIEPKAEGEILLQTGLREYAAEDLAQSILPLKLPAGSYVFLLVRDNGCGMDEKTKEYIFDPFFSTKFTGRGLGMAAVLGIVRTHNAAIFVESEPGRGSQITVIFPPC